MTTNQENKQRPINTQNTWGESYRGFESLSLRQVGVNQWTDGPVDWSIHSIERDENPGSVSRQANRQSVRIGAKGNSRLLPKSNTR